METSLLRKSMPVSALFDPKIVLHDARVSDWPMNCRCRRLRDSKRCKRSNRGQAKHGGGKFE